MKPKAYRFGIKPQNSKKTNLLELGTVNPGGTLVRRPDGLFTLHLWGAAKHSSKNVTSHITDYRALIGLYKALQKALYDLQDVTEPLAELPTARIENNVLKTSTGEEFDLSEPYRDLRFKELKAYLETKLDKIPRAMTQEDFLKEIQKLRVRGTRKERKCQLKSPKRGCAAKERT